jgi:DNA-binding winged helix-turn-helix (wHTH) protein
MNESPNIVNFETWSFDRDNSELIHRDKRPVTLTEKEFGVLDLLIRRSGKFVRKSEIAAEVWKQSHVEANTIEQVVTRIRNKFRRLGLNPDTIIERKSRSGYRFTLSTPPDNSQSRLIGSESQQHIVTDSPRVARMGFTTSAVQAFDHANTLVWTHAFSKIIDPYCLARPKILAGLVRFADIRGRGKQDVIVAVPLRIGTNRDEIAVTEIDCFSSDGKLLWSYTPQATFRFGKRRVVGPWIVWDIFVTAPPHLKIWAAIGHYRWGWAFVVELDPATGKDSIRFVNTGTLYRLNEVYIDDRPHLLIAGFNNEYKAGVLAILDEVRAFAVSPQTRGSEFECVSCSKRVPDYFFVFPRSEINQISRLWEDSVRFIYVHQDEFDVEKSALGDPVQGDQAEVETVHIAYEFQTNPAVRPFSFRFDSRYDFKHRELEEAGKLDHSLDNCPERLNPPPVKVWTPVDGWTEVKLEPMKLAK